MSSQLIAAMPSYAHSVVGSPVERWELLSAHAAAVGRSAAENAVPFGWSELARLAGLLHDIGKCSPAFQAFLQQPGSAAHGPDHSTAGAVEAARLYPGGLGRMLAIIIAGHHAGLADGVAERLTKTVDCYTGWRDAVGGLPERGALRALRSPKPGPHVGFAPAKAELLPGLFTLTVPTGGGKTLASLSFALQHAVTHKLRRIIYVIPFNGGADRNEPVQR